MRTAFIEQLIAEARINKKIFLIVGDLGFSVIEQFANEFQGRFLNAGVAEQDMTGIAAGLAHEGYTVFTYSIGNFPTLRCMEQIRNDLCYHNLNVKIVAVGGGYAYGPLGASHHATEDIGMLRTIPNIIVCAPGDPAETKAVTTLLANTKGPAYLRLGKAGEYPVHKNNVTIGLGKIIAMLKGEKTVVLSTGAMLKYSHDYITDHALNWGLYSCPFIKPLDLDGIKMLADSYEKIICIEEHQKSGGLGSAVLEGFNELEQSGMISRFPHIRRIAIPDIFVDVAGTQEYLRQRVALTLD